MIYTEDHLQMMTSIRRFIDAEVNPFIQEWEDAEFFPAHELFRKMGALGFLGVNREEAYGGLGLDFTYSIAVAEAMGHAAAGGIGMAVGMQTDMAVPALALHGSDELKRDYLAPSISGEYVAALGVSETNAGSDVASVKTSARRDGDDYVINGHKMWITSGTQADWICLLANTSEGPAHKNKSLIVVPLKEEGGKRPKGIEMQKIRKLGNWCSDTAQIFFDNVRVPRRNLIGEEGKGFVYQMQQFQEERLNGAARRLASQNLIDATVEYLRQRIAFGKPILANQFVQFKLAELKTELCALRGLVFLATDAYMQKQDVTEMASMAKLKATRLSREIADWCLQFWGGMGYTWESSTARAFRDSRLGSIGGGADEIMLTIIARKMGLEATA